MSTGGARDKMDPVSMMGGTPQQHGETIADYPSYEGAQKAVSKLIEAEIPAKDIAIVGRGLRSVETITGRLGYAAAARTGAINGILLGLLFSAIFVLGNPSAVIQLFIGVMLVGIAIGMLMSIISYSILRRRRDYTSVTQVVADHYEVTVLPRSLQKAREASGRAASSVTTLPAPVAGTAVIPPAVPPQSPPHVSPAEPPRYGERVDPAPEPTAEPAPPARAPEPPADPPLAPRP